MSKLTDPDDWVSSELRWSDQPAPISSRYALKSSTAISEMAAPSAPSAQLYSKIPPIFTTSGISAYTIPAPGSMPAAATARTAYRAFME